MSVVVVNEMQGGEQSLYDEVTSRVMPEGRLPEGCSEHIAGPINGGSRVISVWDSEQDFERFRNDALIPAMRDTGREEVIAPSVQAQPVYRRISA